MSLPHPSQSNLSPPPGQASAAPEENTPRPWQGPARWFRVNTFAPSWLGRRWQHPLWGVLAGILSQLIAAGLKQALAHVLPIVPLYFSFSLLCIAIIALSWGAVPSAVSTLVGALLLGTIVLPPQPSASAAALSNAIGIVVYLLSGFAISALASQTERARRSAQIAAASLEKERTRLETILEAMPDAVFLHDAQGQLVWLNRKGRQMDGPESEQPIEEGMQPGSAMRMPSGTPLTAEQVPLIRALRGETIEGMELHSWGGAGREERPIVVSVAPLFDERGQVEGAVAVSHDISALRQAQSESARQAALLEAVIEAITDGVFVYDAQGRAQHVNSAGRAFLKRYSTTDDLLLPVQERMAQIPARDEQGQPLSLEQYPAVRVLRGEVLTGADSVDIVLPTLDGGSLQLNVSGAPIRDDKGRQIGAAIAARDVTERRHVERRAKEQMDEFLSIVSHELRTPVTSIKIGVQLMLKRIEQSAAASQSSAAASFSLLQQQEHGLRRVDQQIRRLTYLLDDLIDLSRIRAGKVELRMEECDLAALVREIVEEEHIVHPDRAISLELPTQAPVQAQADPDRIEQVLTNYLTNALKYSESDRPVQVGLQIEGQQAKVWVRDQGPGIPPEEQAQIWELFHRVPGIEVMSGSGIGLGLGLHISKTMIELHGGQVGVESAPGQGATFWFTLPLAGTRAAEPAANGA